MSDDSPLQRYFNAWNQHDAEALVTCFSAGGSYQDPASGGPLEGAEIGAYARSLWSAFPDLEFQLAPPVVNGTSVAVQWRMTGTNHGSFMGLPPTGRGIDLPGCDFLELDRDGLRSVRGHFDTAVLPRQLELQVVVQPRRIGDFSFGTCVAFGRGANTVPGAFSITRIQAGEEQLPEIQALSRATLEEMANAPGFIGSVLTTMAGHGLTVTAWEGPGAIAGFMRGGAHGKAMKRFFEDLGDAGYTSVWIPQRINAYHVRCEACGAMAVADDDGLCKCGAHLPPTPPYI